MAPRLDDTKRYGVVIDAGSSGSRVFIYSWEDPTLQQRADITDTLQFSVPQLTHKPEWKKKISPGISDYGDKTREQLWDSHIQPLVEHAQNHVPKSSWQHTPIFFLATAGMRLLPETTQTRLLSDVCSLLKSKTAFSLGPQGCAQVQIIDGEVEGLYGWLGLNYLAGNFNNVDTNDKYKENLSLGFMDMGGASAQIAFVPNATETANHLDDLYHVRLRSVNGQLQEWNVFVSTWLGFGANEARKRYLEHLQVTTPDSSSGGNSGASSDPLIDPCLPKGLQKEYTRGNSSNTLTVTGSGDFTACMGKAQPLLMKDAPCKELPCLFNGVHAPSLDFAVNRFVGVSEYWYTSADIFGLKEHYDFDKYSAAASEYCSRPWHDILEESERGGFNKMSQSKLEIACFKATWVLSILHEGFGLPIRTSLSSTEDRLGENFVEPFRSVETIDNQELSWTIGRMVLYSASQVPPKQHPEVMVGYVPSMLAGASHVVPGGDFSQYGLSSSFYTPSMSDLTPSSPAVLFLLFSVIGVLFYVVFGKTRVTGAILSSFHKLTVLSRASRVSSFVKSRLFGQKVYVEVPQDQESGFSDSYRHTSALNLADIGLSSRSPGLGYGLGYHSSGSRSTTDVSSPGLAPRLHTSHSSINIPTSGRQLKSYGRPTSRTPSRSSSTTRLGSLGESR